jgi:hypothetical protein
MSNISIQTGEQVNIGVQNRTASGISAVAQPKTSISIAGIQGRGDSHFTFNQDTPESIWEVEHNLGKKPSVTVVDSGESVVVGEIEYINLNSVRLTFAGAFSGKAYFN